MLELVCFNIIMVGLLMSSDIPSFDIFPWNKNFDTGVELIDEQHKVLVEILNRLAGNLANISDSAVLNEIFYELENYAQYHFKTEEAIWYKYFKDDEWNLEHQRTHSSFMDEVNAIKDGEDKKPLSQIAYDIISFLSKWLAYHILDTDKRMALVVIEIESGASLENAKLLAGDTMVVSKKIIVDTVLSMYDTLSTRTLELMRERTLRTQAEDRLQVSEEKWKLIVDGGLNNVWDLDIQNNNLNTSDDDISLFDIVGSNINSSKQTSKIHPADIKQMRSDLQEHIDGKTEFYSNKHRVFKENNSWSWVLSRGKIVSRDKDGNALRIVGTNSDITERELATLIYKNSSQAIFISDANNDIIHINPAFTKITGYSNEDVIGKNPKVLASGNHNKDFYKEMWIAISSNGHWGGEIYNKRKNGEIYPGHLEINVVTDSKGAVDHYFAITNDSTEEYQYKDELQKQQSYLLQKSRMIQMGEMISMIAHQWRQPLGSISATSIDLEIKLKLDFFKLEKENERIKCKDYFTDSLRYINSMVQNLSMTIDDFRDFYKPNKDTVSELIEKPIEKALGIIKNSLELKNIKLIKDYNSDRSVTIYQNEMMQVVLNILKNTQDNFEEKKTIEPKITISTKEKNNSTILEICDNGGGISDSIISKIFDPYFSTKNEKNGTGLGLYMSKIIVETHHKAKISAKNRDDGVCFKIEFFE